MYKRQFQIRTLILTMLYRLVPTLIEQGYVYIAESPLYEITYRDKSYFAFDESEKAAILKKMCIRDSCTAVSGISSCMTSA